MKRCLLHRQPGWLISSKRLLWSTNYNGWCMMGWQCVERAKTKKKVAVQRLKLLNYWVCQLLAYIEESCVKFTAVREENHFYPGCVSITFHFRGSEAEACWRLLTSHRVEHKISRCVGRIKAMRKHTSLGSWLLQQLSSNSSWNLTYRINLE